MLITLILGTALLNPKPNWAKYLLFILICSLTIGVTAALATATLYLNAVSITRGPVHWHADFEIWACEQKLDLVDPKGLLNRVGSPIFHEHNDSRLHVEGVVVRYSDISLETFFRLVGGRLDNQTLTVPTNTSLIAYTNGQTCDGQQPAQIQAFVYRTSGQTFSQTKIDPVSYVLSPYSSVPPGDCLIIEFAPVKETTDKLCQSYQAAIERGALTKQLEQQDGD